jgi:hypothetical protein
MTEVKKIQFHDGTYTVQRYRYWKSKAVTFLFKVGINFSYFFALQST